MTTMTTATAEARTIELYHPRNDQLQFHESDARFRVLACGRRWGKTLACVNELLYECLDNPGARAWWLAPTYQQSATAENIVLSGLHGLPGLRHRRGERLYIFPNDSRLAFKTADNYEALRGEAIDAVVLDEAARIHPEAWRAVVRPMLSDRGGRAVFISTPAGRNWFYALWLRGQEADETEYESWHFPTRLNPLITPEEIESARREMPERTFRQEYEAEFLEDESTVFGTVSDCIDAGRKAETGKGSPGVSIGADLAKTTDYTVLVAFDPQTHSVVSARRFNRLAWPAQERRIRAFAGGYADSAVLVDSTGLGDPVYDHLRAAGLNVRGYKFSSESKRKLIEHLSVEMEAGRVRLPDPKANEDTAYTHLVNELQAFEARVSPSGGVRYEAPADYHDDCVMALALAVWHARHRHTPRALSIPGV